MFKFNTDKIRQWKNRDREEEKKKIHDWLTYHIGWLVGAVLLVWVVGTLIADYQAKPAEDVRVAYVGSEKLSDSAVAAIEDALERYCSDSNGDGEVVVGVYQYALPSIYSISITGLSEYFDQTSLIGDLEAQESELFLLEDAAAFQKAFVRLELPEGNGALPSADDESGRCNSVRWEDCPVLNSQELTTGDTGIMLFDEDREAIAKLDLCLRGYSSQENKEAHAAASELWKIITQGTDAVS